MNVPSSCRQRIGEERNGDVSPGRDGNNKGCGIVVYGDGAASLVVVERKRSANRQRQCARELICLPARAGQNPIGR